MHINRKPGEQVEVDWAGNPATIIDPDTGEIIKAYIFVGVMTYSQYAYVEACLDMKQKSWINAHIHMLLSGKLNDAPSGRLFRADFRTLQMCQSL